MVLINKFVFSLCKFHLFHTKGEKVLKKKKKKKNRIILECLLASQACRYLGKLLHIFHLVVCLHRI